MMAWVYSDSLTHDLVEDAVQMVILGGNTYDIVYMRDDVEEKFAEDDLQAIFDECRATVIDSPHLEEIWKMGSHGWTVEQFEDALVCHRKKGEKNLVVVLDVYPNVPVRKVLKAFEEPNWPDEDWIDTLN